MVHTTCALVTEGNDFGIKNRGKKIDDFYIDGVPQWYCCGYTDKVNDKPLYACAICPDWVRGEQCRKDFEEAYKAGRTGRICNVYKST